MTSRVYANRKTQIYKIYSLEAECIRGLRRAQSKKENPKKYVQSFLAFFM